MVTLTDFGCAAEAANVAATLGHPTRTWAVWQLAKQVVSAPNGASKPQSSFASASLPRDRSLPMSDAALLAFDAGAAWREMPFVAVDVETTGLDTEECRVIEVGIVRFERGQPAERWGMLLDPGVPIPEKVVEVTGITDEMVAGKSKFKDVKWLIRSRIQDRLFVAYNSDFDHRVLEREFERCGLTMPRVPVLDPLVWARRMMPSADSHRLGNVCRKLGVDLDNAHRAEHDAEATGRLTLKMADKMAPTLGMLLSDQAAWRATQDEERAQRRAAKAILRGDDPNAPKEKAVVEEPDRNQSAMF